jgi:hypothetical protein
MFSTCQRSTLSMANTLAYLKERDGITTKKLDDHGDQEVVLKLSQWLMLWNILRSLMVLALRMSMTMESSELC